MTAPKQVASTAQGEAAAVAGTAKNEAGNVASTAAGAAGEVAGTAKQEASNVVNETVTQAKNLTGQVKEQAQQQVSAQSQKLTGSLRGLSEQLSNGDTSGVVGQVLTEVGERVQGLADHLETVGPEGLLDDLRSYARRSPGMFLLGMAAAGFVSGRLVKGMTAGGQQQTALSSGSYGSTGGTYAEPGLSVSSGYSGASPYPDATYDDAAYDAGTGAYDDAAYEPLDSATLGASSGATTSYTTGGAGQSAGSYLDSPLEGDRTRGTL